MLNAPFFLLQDVDTMVSSSKKWKMCLSVKCSLLFVTRCGHYGLFVQEVEDVS